MKGLDYRDVNREGTKQQEYGAIGRSLPTTKTSKAILEGKICRLTGASSAAEKVQFLKEWGKNREELRQH